jgi:agmatinase
LRLTAFSIRAMLSTLRASSCLDFTPRPNGQVEVTHRLVGKKYLVGQAIGDLLAGWQQPRPRHEALADLQARYSPDEAQRTVRFLEEKSLLVSDDTDETFFVQAPRQGLFGLPTLSAPRAAAPAAVLCGLPYGHGNAEDINCRNFPVHLRHFLQATNLVRDPEALDFGFLDRATDFGPLRQRLAQGRCLDWGDLRLSLNEGPHSVHEKIYRAARALFGAGHAPLFLGGDHSVTWPIVRACAETYPAFQLLQFDAHIDVYDGVTPLSSTEPPHHGNFMSCCLSLSAVTVVHQLGIRGLVNSRPHKHPKQRITWASDLTGVAPLPVLDPALPVYLTFDIDFLDPPTAPGTATPVPGGLSYGQTTELLRRLLPPLRIIGADLVEVNPQRDKDHLTLQVASNILLTLLNSLA